MRKLKPWTLDEGVDFVRSLELRLAPTWHVALGGSVLMRGESRKDIDLIIYPHNASDESGWEVLEACLRAAGLSLFVSEYEVRAAWRDAGSTDTKHVSVWLTSLHEEGRRVDVFRLR